MTLRYFLFLMCLSTFLSFFASLLILGNINPQEAGFFAFLFFYLSLFFSLVGSLSLIGFWLRTLFKKQEPDFRLVKRSFRQSLFFSGLLIGCLLLQSLRLLNWWNIMILILAFAFFELFFLNNKKTV